MPLDEYRAKRDFSKTPEPAGQEPAPTNDPPIFVVQKHQASSLHYDLRLEVDGVLASWAVPKGPSTDPSVKRLAMRTEDHPLEYAGFEGRIPAGEYGGGSMIVWDRGTYRNVTGNEESPQPAAAAIERGHFLFQLEGEKLSGGFALRRTGAGKRERWLLVKMREDTVGGGDAGDEVSARDEAGAGDGTGTRDDLTATRPESVLSGRTIEDLQAEDPADR
ncbi:MAG: DNA polymerase ligase N-terminal domain-containing protein [Candidatus Krumholzibacteriia bacterium]